MAELKLLAIPADWPQPEFAMGETVYDLADRPRNQLVPGQVVGLVLRGGSWTYLINFEGYGGESEYGAYDLTREAWECVPVVVEQRPVAAAGLPDDFDPFLDSDDLP